MHGPKGLETSRTHLREGRRVGLTVGLRVGLWVGGLVVVGAIVGMVVGLSHNGKRKLRLYSKGRRYVQAGTHGVSYYNAVVTVDSESEK